MAMRVLPDKFFAAMIAVGPLPGSPRYRRKQPSRDKRRPL